MPHDSTKESAVAADSANEQPPKPICSDQLLRGRRVVTIEHAGQIYRLLVTKNDKLILQK